MKRFTWDTWDYDGDGTAFIVAKSEVPEIEAVPAYIVAADHLSPTCAEGMEVREGWCKWQVRTDWEGGDGEPRGWYVVEETKRRPTRLDGRPLPGWFPVWIVRVGEWY